MGFGVPIDDWLRGPLARVGREHLSESRLKREGYFDAATRAKSMGRRISAGKIDQHPLLWNVLMFQSWLENDAHAELALHA